jgi:predicted RNA-binding Zn-ribbon protein involved in translation (DUF1610 family)
MNPITITIQPPITEHCRSCDYEAHRGRLITSAKCPQCGANNVYHGRRPLPISTVRRIDGCYDLLHPSDKKAQIIFRTATEQRGFIISQEEADDIDFNGTLYDVAMALKVKIDAYLYNRDKEIIATLVETLAKDVEQQETLIARRDFFAAMDAAYWAWCNRPEEE